jgi:hypothetical protein
MAFSTKNSDWPVDSRHRPAIISLAVDAKTSDAVNEFRQ